MLTKVVTSSNMVVSIFLSKLLCFRELSVSSRVVSKIVHLFSLYIYYIYYYIYYLYILSYYLTTIYYILL